MTALDGHYPARLIPHAERIVGAVHDDGPDALLDALTAALAVPAPDDVDPVTALVVILAAMVDPATTTTQRLDWVRALTAPTPRAPLTPTAPAGLQLDTTTVAGRQHAVATLDALGLSTTQVARHLGIDRRTVTRVRARARTAAQHAGTTTLKEAG